MLVASDYDGTLAPIVKEPGLAKPLREVNVALRTLSSLPQTHIAVISGRALRDLAELVGAPDEVHLVGSHGSEFDLDFATSLPPPARDLRTRVLNELGSIADGRSGFLLEEKPASIAFHYRNADRDAVPGALAAIEAGPGAIEGVFTRHGKEVVELSVVGTDKGRALNAIRQRVGASAVIYFGDDLTDEDAFKTLAGPDISVKVGEGESVAEFRVESPEDVARLLAQVSELRGEWSTGSRIVPIERHSLLSDQRTAAMVTPSARVTWLCLPRIDSPAIFAELLGGEADGHFSIKATDGSSPTGQRYLGDSMVLETQWPEFKVIDFLDCSRGRPQNRAGRSELVRIIEGRGKVRIEFVPRLDFGRVSTILLVRENGLELGETTDPIVLWSPGIPWEIHREGNHDWAGAEVELDGRPLVLELRHGTGNLQGSLDNIRGRCELTERYWRGWLEQLTLPSVATEQVRRSALILKSLCFSPTGAISAAATTSLPECMGGVRNWDYRYCWIRDAALTAATLVKLGSIGEAMGFLDWLATVVDRCQSPERLHPLYTVTGDEIGAEAEIGQLAGYAGSRPVRIGNTASRQVQLDVFGPVVQLIAIMLEHEAPLSGTHWRLVESMVQAVQERWEEPDHGIWEVRLPRRHNVHSKAMCWSTVNAAIGIARYMLDRERNDWIKLRDEIRSEVLERGFNPDVGAFTAAYESTDLDAAVLQLGLCGLLSMDDQRMVRTVEAIERVLREGPTVYRYRTDDGLPGREGGFFICASWLVETFIRQGRLDEARSLFDSMINLIGPTGLITEQYDTESGRALGNVPQAYSHLGIIENAISLSLIQA